MIFFQKSAFFIQRIQVCDVNIGGPKRNSLKFVRHKNKAEIL